MDQNKNMSDIINEVNDSIKFAKHNKIYITKIEKGSAEGEMLITDDNMNRYGTVHGGALFSLADTVAGAAAASHGTVCVTLSANINYFRAAVSGKIKAAAYETSRTRKTGLYEVELNDEEGLIAKASYTYYDTEKLLSGFLNSGQPFGT
jgi:acyl-CoA thioesterase